MIAELRPLFLAVVPCEDSRIRPATRQEARQSMAVSQGAAGAGHKGAGTETGFAPDLRMAPGEEMTKGRTAGEDGGRTSAQGGAAHHGGSWARRMLDTPDTTQFMLSKRPESLGLWSCLGCWQESQGQELGRSAGSQSCPFTPAGIGLVALSRVVRPRCALLLRSRQPR